MKNKTIAKVYAQTFLELGKEKGVDVAKEITSLTEVINSSNDLENVLFLDVFTTEEKISVFEAIAAKIELSQILILAVNYLINEKRISLLPLISTEIIVIDDHEKGFLRGTIEGSSEEISEDYKAKLIAAVAKNIDGKKAILEYKKNTEITSGYKITVGDLQLDATIDNQLRSFKESILEK